MAAMATSAALCSQILPAPAGLGRVQSFRKSHHVARLVTRRAAGLIRAEASNPRGIWLPGSTPPAYLDGTLAGDVGFDPLGLAADPEALRWYVQAELVHSRFAMLGVAGILFTDALRVSGLKDLPVWYEAGAAQYDIASTPTLFFIQMLLFGWVETKRWVDFHNPGSQGQDEAFFFFLEPALLGVSNGYPGGPLFNPLGLAADPTKPSDLKDKELANGRLAMVAFLGFLVQLGVTHESPVENLLKHLSDPGHINFLIYF